MSDPASPTARSSGERDEEMTTHPEGSEERMLFCPVCDQRLVSWRCKLICERCGYFMSCADYY